ncbi:MAG: Synechococcus phage Syn30 [Bacteroidota bacterium]|jgi:hypothetical protein
MSVYIDRKYLMQISCRLENFKRKSMDLYNFRCVFCGDSSKNKVKSRGYIFKKSNDYFFRCHNCGKGTTFFNFLNFIDPQMANEYSLERYTSGETYKHNYKKPTFNFKKPNFSSNTETKIDLPSISELPEDHPAKKYILDRKIPKGFHKQLYYAEDFKSFVTSIVPEYQKLDSLPENDPRIIIPFFKENKTRFCLQGRSITNSKIRYITIKEDKDFPKLFGLERIDKSSPIYIVEAPFDSLFVKNCIATADASLHLGAEYFKHNSCEIVLIPDKEPRNGQICKLIKKYIELDLNVCLLPEYLKGKDINEFILNGLTKPELSRIIKENTFSGIRLSLEFDNWKKVDL